MKCQITLAILFPKGPAPPAACKSRRGARPERSAAPQPALSSARLGSRSLCALVARSLSFPSFPPLLFSPFLAFCFLPYSLGSELSKLFLSRVYGLRVTHPHAACPLTRFSSLPPPLAYAPHAPTPVSLERAEMLSLGRGHVGEDVSHRLAGRTRTPARALARPRLERIPGLGRSQVPELGRASC